MGFMSWAKRLNELAPEVQLLNYVVYAWMILQIVVVLVNPQKRAIHDFIAGTLQVRLAPPAPPVLEAGTKPLT